IRSTLPRPSLRLQNARPPFTGSARHHIHIEGLVTPAIGPTVRWWWQGSSVISPAARIRSASATDEAQPSNRQAPISAPRSGPEASDHSIGGHAGGSGPAGRAGDTPA